MLVLSTIRPALFVARGVQKGHFQFAPEKDDIARQLYSYCQKRAHTFPSDMLNRFFVEKMA